MPLNILLGLGIGFLIPLHVAMNSRAGVLGGSAALANVFFWVSGLAAALIAVSRELFKGGPGRMGQVPLPLWLAGALGALISLSISLLIPRLGVAKTSFLTILGQMLASSLMSHLGFLGPRDPFSLQKLLGLLVMAAGLALIVFERPSAA